MHNKGRHQKLKPSSCTAVQKYQRKNGIPLLIFWVSLKIFKAHIIFLKIGQMLANPRWDQCHCGFCLSRILLYFHMSLCVCVCHRRDISAFLHCARFWTIQTIYFLKGNDIRTSKTMFPGVWRANTQIQLRSKLQIDLTCAIFLKR